MGLVNRRGAWGFFAAWASVELLGAVSNYEGWARGSWLNG